MKKKKNLKARCRKSRNEEAEARQVEIQHSGCPITNLPSHILVAILFRLPIKEIIFCKCTCKSLYDTISNPEFANLHHAQSEILPIVRIDNDTHVSRILHLLELEQDERLSIDEVSVKFDSKLKIPLRNFPLVLRDDNNGNKDTVTSKAKANNQKVADSPNRFLCLSKPYRNKPVAVCNEDMILTSVMDHNYKRNSCIRELKATDHNYKIVNSCNGFLCLSKPSCNNPVVVCNPVTGEFINLPQVTKDKNVGGYFDCGFGFSPMTNQYKVVRLFKKYSRIIKNYGQFAQVHILGTGSWKNIEFAPYSDYKLLFPTYLNGAVHWFCLCGEKLSQMVSFDCEKDYFRPVSLPPLKESNIDTVRMGVLGGCLCICDSSSQTSIFVWLMNCGVEKSWTQVFEIDMCRNYGPYQPIKYMNTGALLMFNCRQSVLVYYDPRKPELKLFECHPIESKYEIVAHTPSFISLVDVLEGCNVEVLNVVYSRCAGLKLKGEYRTVSLHVKTNFEN